MFFLILAAYPCATVVYIMQKNKNSMKDLSKLFRLLLFFFATKVMEYIFF